MFSKNTCSSYACSFFNLLVLALLFTGFKSFAQQIRLLDTPPISSIRGMSVVNDSVVWVSGTGGQAGITTDAGAHWKWVTVPGHDSCDWRSLISFSNKRALLLNAGEPAFIMLTTDGGDSWEEVYRNNTKGIFFDGIAFKNAKEGIAVGDPLNGKFMIIQTHDSGRTWQALAETKRPAAEEGEAIFAASNSSVVYAGNSKGCFITGGRKSRFFTGWDNWTSVTWPMIDGGAGTGAFSVAFDGPRKAIVVGGDYMRDTLATGNCVFTNDGGRTWQPAATPPSGYRSCVKYISPKLAIATGTSGTDISRDGGLHWHNIGKTGFHVAGVAPNGKKIWLAGNRKLAVIDHLPK